MSDLDRLLGATAPAARPSPQAAPVSPAGQAEGGQEEGLATGDEPYGVVQVELPSGIEVYYQAGPKRIYRLRQLLQPKPEFTDWREVPSMSTVTKCLDKPGLVDWAEKIGINLVQELLRNGWVDLDFATKFERGEKPDPRKPWWGGAHLQEIGKTKRLRSYQMKDLAANRGTSIHQALEGWAMSGQLADPEVFPEDERGYIMGLNKFLTESRFQASMSEVIVASVEHEVAGRFDLLGHIKEPVELVYHLTEKNERRKVFEPCSALIDLKTSSGVFEDHQLQVAGYMGCLVESGYEPVEKGYVLRTTWDGRYEFIEVRAEWLDFWFLRGLYDAINRIDKETREARK